MSTEADTGYNEAVEANEIMGELLTHPVIDWRRIAALAERVLRIAERLQN